MEEKNQPNLEANKFLKSDSCPSRKQDRQEWEGSELFLPLCGVTFVFFLTRFLKMALFCDPPHWFLLLYAASPALLHTECSSALSLGEQVIPAPVENREARGTGSLAPPPRPPSSSPSPFASWTSPVSGTLACSKSPCSLVVQPELLFQQHPFCPRKRLCQVREGRCIGKCSFLKKQKYLFCDCFPCQSAPVT